MWYSIGISGVIVFVVIESIRGTMTYKVLLEDFIQAISFGIFGIFVWAGLAFMYIIVPVYEFFDNRKDKVLWEKKNEE
jgi:hypothetical protein